MCIRDRWKVILTPGHTEGGICLFIDPRFGTNPEGAPVLISGDTLFCGSIGRTDFQGGDMNAMRRSLKRLACLLYTSVSGESWHEGVKGIVASRLVNTYGVPSLLRCV